MSLTTSNVDKTEKPKKSPNPPPTAETKLYKSILRILVDTSISGFPKYQKIEFSSADWLTCEYCPYPNTSIVVSILSQFSKNDAYKLNI